MNLWKASIWLGLDSGGDLGVEGFEHHCIRGHDLHPEMGSMIDEIFRKVPLYHYQQSQLWFECSNEDVYEMVVTCHERNAVAVSIIKKIEYGIINKARYIVAGGPVYLNYGALESHLCYLKQIYLEKGIDLRIAPQFQVGLFPMGLSDSVMSTDHMK